MSERKISFIEKSVALISVAGAMMACNTPFGSANLDIYTSTGGYVPKDLNIWADINGQGYSLQVGVDLKNQKAEMWLFPYSNSYPNSNQNGPYIIEYHTP